MAELLRPVHDYRSIAAMWVRAALAYPTSFWMMSVGGALTSGLDFVGLWLMFHTIDTLGGFGSPRSGCSTAPPASASASPTC